MSRIGNRIIKVPTEMEITIENNKVIAKKNGEELFVNIPEGIKVSQINNEIKVERENDNYKPLHGTVNALIENMIKGLEKEYEKGLEIVGVGYKFQVSGNKLIINAGYSKPVEMEIPHDIKVETTSNTEIVVKSRFKDKLGEYAANIRKVRPPEPYKGKGIKYKDEHIRRKEGKKAT